MFTKETRVEKQNIQDILSLTALQEGMLFHYLQNPDSKHYFEQLLLNLRGFIDPQLVKAAWNHVCAANEMLRTVFRWEKLLKPVQLVLKTCEIPLRVLDLTDLSPAERTQKLAEIRTNDREEGIDIRCEPFRVTLVLLTDTESAMLITNHHILYDGWSNGVLLTEFFQTYQTLAEGLPLMQQRKTSFREFVKWLQKQDSVEQKQYWTEYLGGFEVKTQLPDRSGGGVQSTGNATGRYHLHLDSTTVQQLQHFATAHRITPASIFYTVWGLLLQRYTNTDDVLFGTTVSGRNVALPDIEQMIGLFINTIPLRVTTNTNQSILALLQEVDQTLKVRSEHEHVPLVEIKSCSVLDSRDSLFDSIVIIENYPLDQQLANDAPNHLQVVSYSIEESSDYDLTLAVELADQYKLQLVYQTGKFTAPEIERFTRHYCNILHYVLQHPLAQALEIEMLSPEERHLLLHQWSGIQMPYPAAQTFCHLFAECAARMPDAIAVQYQNQQLSYIQLNQRSDQLAHFLQKQGIGANQVVGIMAERSLELMVGILGILKAGGAYLPINPNDPEERIRFMLEDSKARILLTQKHLQTQAPFDGEIHALEEIDQSTTIKVDLPHDSGNMAYVIYTSGSTGKPKGVMITHRSLVNFIFNYYHGFSGKIGQGDMCLTMANIAFDASVSEIFLPLAFGATLVFYNNEMIPDVHTLARMMIDLGITLCFIPPSLFKPLYELFLVEKSAVKLNKIMTGIEPILDSVFADYTSLHPEMQILNGYGPTETTICATYYKYLPAVPIGKKVPIGKPLANLQVYILDQYLRLVPPGVPGELCVAGDGLAMGYLNRPDLTAEKFVQNPFDPEARLYRTGDLAHWLPDGNLAFVGRVDHQVKIRGYRIEPGEIQSHLLRYKAIQDVVVLAREDGSGVKYLCAYFIGNREVTVKELREYLSQSLPEYMIPSYFIQLDRFPLNANGKIDRKALPAPEGQMIRGTVYEAPQTEIEHKLVAIWKEILGIAEIGINDNFFEFGGHSLKATGLAGKLHKEFDVVVPINQIFLSPTIKELGSYIQTATQSAYTAIVQVGEKEFYETSSAQKRIYMLQQIEPENTRYNMPGVFRVEGIFDLAKVEQALWRLMQRHEVLRTSFTVIEEQIVQQISADPVLPLEILRITMMPEENEEEVLQNAIVRFVRPFELAQAPLFRVQVIELSSHKSLLLFDMHHIISDGSSMAILINEFVALYAGDELPALRIQYKDYAAWQNQFLQSSSMHQQEAYWLGRFSDEIPVLNLPTDFKRPAVQSMEGVTICHSFDQELTHRLHEIAGETGATMYMVLLAGFNILLSRYSGQSDLIIGSPIAGRPHADLEGIIGMFVNTLALRNQLDGQQTYVEFLASVKENALQAFANQDYPFEALVERLAIDRDLSRNPLFDVMFAMQNMEHARLQLPGAMLTQYPYTNATVKFDLTVMADETEEGLVLDIEYSSRLWKEATVRQMFMHLTNILLAVAANPQIKLAEIDLLTPAEKAQILGEFNNTAVNYPSDRNIVQLFAEQVERTPDQTAVVCSDQRLTYRELDLRANPLAILLQQKGVISETIVGIMAERSLEMMIGILAILKAGGAYLPLDPEYPVERIQYMLEDCGVKILLTQGEDGSQFPCEVLDICKQQEEITVLGESNAVQQQSQLLHTANPDSLAYVIYTSGSTGRPKGVMVEHRSIVRLVKNPDYVKFRPGDKILQTGTLAFDASTFEIWGALTNGLELHLAPKDLILNTGQMEQYLASQQITTVFLTTALFNLFAEERPEMFATLSYVLTGGEMVSPRHTQKVRRACQNLKLMNVYGPTENTTFSTSYPITEVDAQRIPIGRPIHNSTAYIIDLYGNLCPIGVYGELCVGGDGLARGYINNPALTAEKFIENPFQPGERMYRTGDLARWLPDGNIDFLGRVDHQVKIRGFRIEPGEIENHLLQHEQVEEAIVMAHTDPNGEKYLCAYVVMQEAAKPCDCESTQPLMAELRTFLAKNLPDYMIPSCFVQLERMPLNRNGKIDRNQLPEPDGMLLTDAVYEAPRTVVEEQLARICAEVLRVERVGIHDNFFEMGGHSLKATILASKIHQTLQVELPLREVFRRPTVKSLAEYISTQEENQYSSIQPVEEQDYYPASFAQIRLYLQYQFEGAGISYNMPWAFVIEGDLNTAQVQLAFRQLIQRHQTLRTSFEMMAGEVVQRVWKEVEFAVSLASGTEEEIPAIVKGFVRPFDLSTAPLLRVGLVQLAEAKHLLLFDLHHIISDGTSMGILVKEFVSLYEQQELPPLAIQYKDYSAWQQKIFQTGLVEQEQYWLQMFHGEIPVLTLPADFPRPAIQSFAGSSITFEVDESLTRKLNSFAKENDVTLYMTLLAAYNLLLANYTGQEDVVVGSPIAGRPHADLQGLIGMFVNTLAMRNYPRKTLPFKEFLSQVKETALGAYEHQDYPFEQLVGRLDLRRDTSRNPLFDTMFALQNMEQGTLEIAGLRFIPYELENSIAKFDLSLYTYEVGAKIVCNLEYCTRLFTTQTLEKLVGHFTQILQEITANPEQTLLEIDMLSVAEKHRLLVELNDTKRAYPAEKTVHQLFMEQASRTPDDLAVVWGEQSLTYRELDIRSNQLARNLRAQIEEVRGTVKDSIVALLADRSLEMIVAILAILKAGSAYLPIDPDYPEERVTYMLTDSGAEILLTNPELAEKVQYAGVVINIYDPAAYHTDPAPLINVNTPDDLLYLIYTSGSTGKPKGAMIEHKNIVNLIFFQSAQTRINCQTKVLQFTTISFDVSYQEIFSTLLAGGQLYLIDNQTRKEPTQLLRFLGEHEIEVLYLPTSYFKFIASEGQYLKDFPVCIKHIVVAGEQLIVTPGLRDFLRNTGVYLHNHYGPSEAHVVSTYTLEPEDSIPELPPIGKPISNTRLYIGHLDTATGRIHLVPERVQGELFIAGDCVGRGYHHSPELTASKFLTDPFAQSGRLYRTGDLAKWLPDGNVEYMGRIDHQVKIRGYRVEIGEIESCLLKQDSVKEATVIVKGEETEKYLCAYVVGKEMSKGEKEKSDGLDRKQEIGERESDETPVRLNLAELRASLAKELPDYMVPAYFIQLESMPMTPNGKIDRRALPEPEGEIETGVEYVAPANTIEEILATIWQDILGLQKVGVRDNFFNLGGHSLKATILAGKIHQELNVEVPLREIFRHPTIQALAEYIGHSETTVHSAIRPVAEQPYYPASSAQKRLYLQDQLEGASVSYNMPGAFRVEGKLDICRVEETFTKLVQRHETLRTSFAMVDGEIVQKITPVVDFSVSRMQASLQEIPAVIQKFVQPFDLHHGSLLRVGTVELAEDTDLLIFDMHHSISDGVSMNVLIREFIALYEGLELPPLAIQYKDFAVWQKENFENGVIHQQEAYWMETFAGEIPVLSLPTDYPRPVVQSFAGGHISFDISPELTRKLNHLAKATDSTLYMVLLSCYNILLSQYAGQEEIVVGSPVAGRRHADLQGLIGMFVNTLAIRNHPAGTKTFREFLQDVKENALKAFENQDYPLEELIERLQVPRNLSRNPLFDAVFVLQNMEQSELQVAGHKFVPYEFENHTAKFDLTLSASETGESMTCVLEYSSQLFKPETVNRMITHLCKIFVAVTADPEVKLGAIDMLAEEEKRRILYDFNRTFVDYPRDRTITQLFTEQVALTPDHIAVVWEESRLTYRELNAWAHTLAVQLRARGVQRDTIVGIVAEPSLELIIGVVAILKAGGAYLPIDPDYPADRIRLMLEDCAVPILLSQGDFSLDEGYPCEGMAISGTVPNCSPLDALCTELPHWNTPEDLAYVIYTSGSTGKPKGVMVEHRGVVRLVKNTDYVAFHPGDRILQTGTLAFDASTFEIWGALLNGLELHLGAKDLILSTSKMAAYLLKHQITTMFLTTSLFHLFAEERPDLFQTLSYLLIGGEALSAVHVQRVRQACKSLCLINGYGPTENTTFSTAFSVKAESSVIPIGKPIANSAAYILDRFNRLCPVGVYGELCVGGDGLARGYINQVELTAEKFVQNPLIPGMRMYRTGDLARWLDDGNIDFLGRMDHQVKIRGFRIELGEIENQLLGHEAVKETVVLARNDEQGNKYLCAYVVASREVQPGEFREHLTVHLPDYMIPSCFIKLEKMPLNRNGKIDRMALPEPEGQRMMGTEYEAPRNAIEAKLAEIWADVLGLERAGIHDHFFELGGHSLKATVLVSRVLKELGVDLSLRDFFKRPTIKALGEFIQGAEASLFTSIQPVEEREYYPASPAQRRLYLQNQFARVGHLSDGDAGSERFSADVSYNMPGAVIVEGTIDREKFAQVFRQLVERHETLRTSFALLGDEVVQQIWSEIHFTMDNLEVEENALPAIVSQLVRPFDLAVAPLLRVTLIRYAQNRHILFFDMHHIIADGVSMDTLVREFVALYQGETLPELRIQYKDFAVWQNELLTNGTMKQHEQYWLDLFAEEIPVLDLPTDYPRPSVQSFRGNRLDYTIERELMVKLKQLAADTGTTLYMILLAAFNVLLARYSRQEDIVVGSPVAGRRHADLQPLIGMFVNMIALRNAPCGVKTFRDFLAEVKENTLQAFDHQDYQFEELLEQIHVKRDLSRNPLFDVVLSLQDATHRSVIETGDLRLLPYTLASDVAKYDLTLEVIEGASQLLFSLEYCIDLFSQARMERFAEHFVNILRETATNPERCLADVQMISDAEKVLLLDTFNTTEMEYAHEKTLHELFAEQVKKTPERIALVSAEEKLTYVELNLQADCLAEQLRKLGVQRDEIVAVTAERSVELLVGILAILKAGAAYMPIDPEYPVERIEFMLADSGTSVLLTNAEYWGRGAEKLRFNGVIIEMGNHTSYSVTPLPVANINSPTDLAYVMYTSGSTGKPKGVMIEHRSVVSLAAYYNQMFQLDQRKNVLHMSNVSFDTSVVEIFPPLIYGATVHVIRKELALDRERFMEYVRENQIHFAQFVPMTLQEILGLSEPAESLESVVVGGDKLEDRIKDQILSLGYRLTNHYGPTESTVDALVAVCEKGKSTIGKPIANTRVYVLDQYGNPLPVGVPGELGISGVGLARGYLNQPELTAERFVPNPWREGERIYHTGDLACWQADGTISFLGRIDNQVKIRGYRIELGEIEQCLLNYDGVTGAVVVDRVDAGGSKYLCAYLVRQGLDTGSIADTDGWKEETVFDLAQLRSYLAQELPEYMIPACFLQIERIPLTHNGKVDRQALPEPEGVTSVGVEYAAPASTIEEQLISIWENVLGITEIGVEHNFFELGGHSLKAVQIVNRIHQECNVRLGLQDLFTAPTVRELAKRIEERETTAFSAIEKLPEQEYYELSYNQKRLWILSQLEPDSRAYNLPGRITFLEGADEARIRQVVTELVKRHESLRTRFKVVEGTPMQQIISEDECRLEVYDLQKLDEEERSRKRATIFDTLAAEAFRLVESPLLRTALVIVTPDQFDIIFCMHHIISDGWSLEILQEEFHQIYEAVKKGEKCELVPLAIQYKDFAAWQNRLIADPRASEAAREYWRNKLHRGFPVLNLPEDYSATLLRDRNSAAYRVVIPAEVKDQLKEQANTQKTSLFTVLTTVFQMFLADLTGQEEIAIGVPSSGRQHQNLNTVIGFFINTIVLLNQITPEQSFREVLEQVRTDTVKALQYQDYPLELITDELKIQYPKIQVFFNMLNMGQTHLETLENVESYHVKEVQDVKFDLMFYLIEYSNGIELFCSYLTGLFKPATIEYIVGEYIRFTAKMIGCEKDSSTDENCDDDDDLIIVRD